MSILYVHEVSYYEVTFTIPRDPMSNATLGNLVHDVRQITDKVGATADARYGKGYEWVHFTIEFADSSEFDEVYEELEAWAQEHGAK